MLKTSLQDAMLKASGRTPITSAAKDSTQTPSGASVAMPAERMKSFRAKTRQGKKVISGFFEKEASRQLARMAVDQDRTNEDLLREALNDLFTKYHLPPLA